MEDREQLLKIIERLVGLCFVPRDQWSKEDRELLQEARNLVKKSEQDD